MGRELSPNFISGRLYSVGGKILENRRKREEKVDIKEKVILRITNSMREYK